MDNALILIVEDEPEIAEILDAYLGRDGFRTVRAGDGVTALQHHRMLRPDLVVLDVKLPKADGFEVLAEIRRRGDTPVIMATALAEDLDKLSALRIGADDYVVKPFNPLELVARARAVLRRTRARGVTPLLRLGPLEIDPQAYSAAVVGETGTRPLDLTLTEFRLLEHMARAPRRVFSRAELLDACLPDGDALERTVDSHVSNLRRKLEAAGAPDLLEGVRGVGYRLSHLT
ncbi:response regulator [Phenylobacterium sp.]|uniref:response regulator n=1 Tax=Phenylobacterium sp. TaxID=1871053 RepID=UPI0028978E4B|nr:response regulator [Phenylobacterium sp.]